MCSATMVRGQDGAKALHEVGWDFHIVDFARCVVVKVGVLVKVGAITRRLANEVDLLDQAALHEGFEAVVDRGQRDCRHPRFYPIEDLFGCRMVAFGKDHFVDHFTVWSGAQTAVGEALRRVVLEGSAIMESVKENWNRSKCK